MQVTRLDLLGDLRVIVPRPDRPGAVRVAVFPVVAGRLAEPRAGRARAVSEPLPVGAVAARTVVVTARTPSVAERTIAVTPGPVVTAAEGTRRTTGTNRPVSVTARTVIAATDGAVTVTTRAVIATTEGAVRPAGAVGAVTIATRPVIATTERAVRPAGTVGAVTVTTRPVVATPERAVTVTTGTVIATTERTVAVTAGAIVTTAERTVSVSTRPVVATAERTIRAPGANRAVTVTTGSVVSTTEGTVTITTRTVGRRAVRSPRGAVRARSTLTEVTTSRPPIRRLVGGTTGATTVVATLPLAAFEVARSGRPPTAVTAPLRTAVASRPVLTVAVAPVSSLFVVVRHRSSSLRAEIRCPDGRPLCRCVWAVQLALRQVHHEPSAESTCGAP
ncbi:hypothetical protein DEJ16_13675 [Curtobacterium sp. MCJR17_055]|nr:hypothetical protein DEI87_12135 [Curtobacterium sp. MCBD17_029]PYY53187.1 hypothetical protein DEJ16_13675 [Curtobacterium sp. MCJR17_055]PYY56342.1 hypothetical protein DEJ26_12915 [Curtobacterium sp. MCPF17_015]